MRAWWKLTWTEVKVFLREPMSAFFTLVCPLMFLFLFGSIYGNKPSSFFGGFGSVDVSVPGYIAIIIANCGLISLAVTVGTYRENGVLRRLNGALFLVNCHCAAHVNNFLGQRHGCSPSPRNSR